MAKIHSQSRPLGESKGGRTPPARMNVLGFSPALNSFLLSSPMLSRITHVCLLLSALLTGRATAQFYGKDVHEVGTGAEFVRALGSDRTLQLTAARITMPVTEPGLVIRGLKNLRILGAETTGTEIVSLAGGSVLGFVDCRNLDLRRLTIRFESTVTNGVLAMTGVTNVLLRDCSLSGVAATGLVLRRAVRVKVLKSTVLNCGAGILQTENSRNLHFEDCLFRRNEGDFGFRLNRTYDLRMEDCEFVQNTFKTELVGLTGSSHVMINGGKFTDNRYPRTAPPTADVKVLTKKEGR